MNKKLFFLSVLLVIGILFTAWGAATTPHQMTALNQSSNIHQISAHLQATEAPLPMPTIQIIPPDSNGGSTQIPYNTILVYVLVGAVILIALVAVLRKS